MIAVSGVSMRFGSKVLFEDVTTTFSAGRRYGLTGPNGAGKSTFMKLLTGELDPQRGAVVRPARLGVLRQDHYAFDEHRVIDTVIMGNARLWAAMVERDALYARAEMSDADGMRLGELEGIVGEEDGYSAESDAAVLLQGPDIPDSLHERTMAELQGGQKVRVLLAQALYGRPQALLLDEPTNHLDLDSIHWLQRFLSRYDGTLIVISHDRHFLNGVCTHVADIDYETIITYTGGYDDMVVAKTQVRATIEAGNAQREKKIAQLNDFIARFGAGTRASQVTSRRKEVERLQTTELARSNIQRPYIKFAMKRPSGRNVLECEAVAKAHGATPVITSFDVVVNRGDRIVLVGRNGVGKTTLLKALLADAPGVPLSRGDLDAGAVQEIHGLLGQMLFSGEEGTVPKTIGDNSARQTVGPRAVSATVPLMGVKSLTALTGVACLWLALLVAVPVAVTGQPGAKPVDLPSGPGKELVESSCASCHGLNLIPDSWGYTRQGWHDLIGTMIALPRDQADTVTSYLAKHFPEKPAPAAVIVKGPVEVTIKEWLVPTLGSRPRDPLSARDGSFWWAAMYGHRLGRLDLKTGDMKEFPLPEGAGPHGLVDDEDGNVWYTGMRRNAVGVLDPKTGRATEHPLPEGFRGPHTPVIDPKGMVWFTVQSGAVGRLNPDTGEMKLAKPASTPTYPYGIQINSKGIPWYVDFRGNRIASINPETMEITEYPLPNPDARPRRIAITPDDAIWYTDYPRGSLGRFDPATRTVREWRSPGGEESRPYGIANAGDILWYSESGVRPNTLVRFDPKSEQFQTWIIPSGGGIVRHMMATPEGDVLLACSGVNRVAFVDVKSASSR